MSSEPDENVPYPMPLTTRWDRSAVQITEGSMEQCESKVGGICGRPATWKQAVHAGQRQSGRILLHSYWCDEHADRIAQKRKTEWLAPADMARLVAETP